MTVRFTLKNGSCEDEVIKLVEQWKGSSEATVRILPVESRSGEKNSGDGPMISRWKTPFLNDFLFRTWT